MTHTSEGVVAGTAAYMSPEQAQGRALDARSDVFSLGAVLYEMLSGARAFGGDTAAEILSAVLRDDPPPLIAPDSLGHIVRRCLAKHPGQRFASMLELKAALQSQSALPSLDAKASIAVLPFENMSGDKENEYFSDGLAEEIINLLARIPDLKVIARTSAFAFKGKHEDVRKIALALGVTTVLEGSVRKAGDRIRVTAQLIAAADGSHLWSERYDRQLADVFTVQDEIATAITAALQVTLSPVAAAGAAPRAQSASVRALSQGALRRESAHTRVDGRRAKALGTGDRARSTVRGGARTTRQPLWAARRVRSDVPEGRATADA